MSKLAIEASSEDDIYDVATKIVCLECGVDKVEDCPPKAAEVVDKLMKAPTFSRKEEVKAWEQELVPCEHTIGLQQGSNQGIRIRGMNLGHISNLYRASNKCYRTLQVLRM